MTTQISAEPWSARTLEQRSDVSTQMLRFRLILGLSPNPILHLSLIHFLHCLLHSQMLRFLIRSQCQMLHLHPILGPILSLSQLPNHLGLFLI